MEKKEATMEQVTITSVKNGREALKCLTIKDFHEAIRREEYLPLLRPMRGYYPSLVGQLHPNLALVEAVERDVPQVCFDSQLLKQQGQLKQKAFNALVTLEVDNLPGLDEAVRLRRMAAQLPYTRLAFVSATGRGIVIVCKVGWGDHVKAETKEQMEHILLAAYARLHYLYSAQLALTLDNQQPQLAQFRFVSADSEAYYNPCSEPFFVGSLEMPELPQRPEYPGCPVDATLLPGYTARETQHEVFEWCLHDAMEKARLQTAQGDDAGLNALSLLAAYCAESGLPMDFAVRRLQWKPQFDYPAQLVERTFQNAYDKQTARTQPFAHINKNALLVYQTEAFLHTHYELRRNVMTGVVQFRQRDGYRYDFQDLTDAALNTMTNRALKAGLGSWDKDVRRLLDSNDVPLYEPLADYLYQLPRWDGKDHVGALVRRIPTGWTEAGHYLHLWLLSTVAHWLGKCDGHGNAIVPLLIGDQGCGKTSFAAQLLPPELQDYYNDRVDFKNDTALMLGLTSFALINIDEFDAVKRTQQPVLKYLLSKSDVKMRPPYGKSYVQRRRFASFLATTNHLHPLTDPTGSRRFVCIHITPGQQIDFLTPIDHAQLYAQLLHELNGGARYWLDPQETTRLIKHNLAYNQQTDLAAILDTLFRAPRPNEDCKPVSVGDIATTVCQNYPNITPSRGLNKEVGRILNQRGYEKKHTTNGQSYVIARQ